MPNARILIVEDEPLIALDTKKTLEDMEFQVTALAHSAEEAIHSVEKDTPDLILMDILLGGEVDGIETVRTIHSRYDIPVIYMTANADADIVKRARETAPYGYLNKPFTERDLFSAIDSAINMHGMQTSLQQNREQLQHIMEEAPAAIIIYDENGILYVNTECQRVFGNNSEDFIGKNIWEFIHHDHRDLVKDRVQARLREEDDVPAEYDAKVVSSADEEIWLHFKASHIIYNEKKAILVHGLDITLMKQIESILLKQTEELEAANEEMQSTIEEMEAVNEEFEATNEELIATNQELHESQQRYSSLFNNSKTPMLVIDPADGSIFDANTAACEFYGYDADTLMSMNIRQINLLDDDQVKHEMEEAASDRRSYFIFRHQLSDGSARDVEVYSGPIVIEGREYLYSLIHDITDRVEAEKKLYYAGKVIENSPAVLFRWLNEEDWPVDFVTHNVTRFGYTPDELLSGDIPFKSIVHPDDLTRVQDEIREHTAAGKENFRQEYRIKGKDGNIYWVDDRTSVERDENGSIIHYEGIVIDITERKELEEEQSFHSMLLNQIQDLVTATDLDGNITYVNDAECRMLHKSREELIGKPVSQYGDDADMGATQEEIYKTVTKEGAWRGEVVNYDNSGNRLILDSRVWKIFNDKGDEIGLCGIATDITEKKKMENALKESEERYRAIFNMMNAGIAISDEKGNWIDFNERACELLGYSREELLTMTNTDLTHPDDLELTAEYMNDIVNGKRDSFQVEKRYIRKDDTIVWVDLYIQVLRNKDNNIKGLMGVAIDITDRKKAEEELLQSEMEMSLVLNSTYEMFCYYDTDLRIQWANRAAAHSVNMEPEDMIGLYCYNLWNQSDTPCDDCPVLKAKETGIPHETERETPDGRMWFLRGHPVLDDEGKIAALVEFGQDITVRKESEEKVLEALKEKETLLREIHHRVKNNFQVITSLLNFQTRNIEETGTRKVISEIQQRIRAMALIHEKLYQTGDLTSINFYQYASIIVTELNYAYSREQDTGLKKMDVRMDDINLTIEKAIPCGLILNELVSNSLKHAFPDNEVANPRITITMDETDGEIHLSISDNGIGLPDDLDPDTAQSMGMSLVPLLVNQLNGTLKVDTGEGTGYHIYFKR